mgnify:CR=1 FL=1
MQICHPKNSPASNNYVGDSILGKYCGLGPAGFPLAALQAVAGLVVSL